MQSYAAYNSMIDFFFFQAEDGIRDRTVTGVQTWLFRSDPPGPGSRRGAGGSLAAPDLEARVPAAPRRPDRRGRAPHRARAGLDDPPHRRHDPREERLRSEERRVGKV